MNKTAENEWSRLFLIESLPDPLTPASAHLQIFDNYIENTRLRLRSVRDPSSKTWSRSLQQRFATDEKGLIKTAEIHLNDDEYAAFEGFEGREIRKNRYFHEFDGRMFAFDVYLGNLWGLNTAKVDFGDAEQAGSFIPPRFAVFEVTDDPFFTGRELLSISFADVQARLSSRSTVSSPSFPDE